MSFYLQADPIKNTVDLSPFVDMTLEVYRRYKQDPIEALLLANIDLSAPSSISMGQLLIFARHAMKQLDDETLGWLHRKIPWGSLGMLMRGSISAPDVRLALIRWIRHHNLLLPETFLKLEDEGKTVTLSLTENGNPWSSTLAREVALTTIFRSMLGYICWIADSNISLFKASTPINSPLNPLHSTLFDVPVDYAKGPACISFDSRYLDLPNRRNDQELKEALRREAIYFATHRYLRDRILVSRVMDILNDSIGVSAITAEKMAKALHISPRTLHRQLKDEDTSLQALKNAARLNKAIDLLVHSQRPIKHISQSLGFNHVQGFNRSFKQWTGKLPSSYRKSAGVKESSDATQS